MAAALSMGCMTSCYDLTELAQDPYALPNNTVSKPQEPVDPVG